VVSPAPNTVGGQHVKEKRLYGLFKQEADGKWRNMYPALACKKSSAVRKFQDMLLASAMGYTKDVYRLRPCKAENSLD
jgi:hypothetical protein